MFFKIFFFFLIVLLLLLVFECFYVYLYVWFQYIFSWFYAYYFYFSLWPLSITSLLYYTNIIICNNKVCFFLKVFYTYNTYICIKKNSRIDTYNIFKYKCFLTFKFSRILESVFMYKIYYIILYLHNYTL